MDQRQLTIRTRAGKNGDVEVLVGDRGHGLPADAADRVFDSFFSTKPHGMGMGLAISRSIIEFHRGRLWASPSGECGATFQFTLPTVTGVSVHDA